jgi:hypothetical protein
MRSIGRRILAVKRELWQRRLVVSGTGGNTLDSFCKNPCCRRRRHSRNMVLHALPLFGSQEPCLNHSTFLIGRQGSLSVVLGKTFTEFGNTSLVRQS